MSRYRKTASADLYEDLSLAVQSQRFYEELIAPPEIEVPIREYNQRSAFSGIPDGSFVAPDVLPIGEPIDKFCTRLSKEAAQAWKLWTTGTLPVLLSDGTTINPINKPIVDFLLTPEEQKTYIRLKRLKLVEQGRLQQQQDTFVSRLVQESFPSSLDDDTNTNSTIPEESRYFTNQEIIKDQYGNITVHNKKIDRCNGQPAIKHLKNTKIGIVSIVTSNPSYQERLEHLNMSSYQTEKWRKPAKEEETKYLPNVSIQDDPDYINPLSMSSRNFIIWPPASRPYNIVFKVYYANGQVGKIYPTKGIKDYTSLSSIIYMLKSNKTPFTKVVIDEIKLNNKYVPNCKFEIDLRVTYNEDMIPDPINYKKVDPQSVTGMKIIQFLNEQPYLFQEFSWDYKESSEGQKETTTKKVAVGFTVKDPKDSAKNRVYWVYLDEDQNTIGKLKIFSKKVILPQYTYTPYKFYSKEDNLPNYQKIEHPFLATVRVSDGCYYYSKKEERFIYYKEVQQIFFDVLQKKGYLFIKDVPENHYNNVRLFYFVHNSMSTKQQRLQVFLSLNKKYV